MAQCLTKNRFVEINLLIIKVEIVPHRDPPEKWEVLPIWKCPEVLETNSISYWAVSFIVDQIYSSTICFMNLIISWHRHFYCYMYVVAGCYHLSSQVIPLFYKICFILKISPDWQNIKQRELFPLWEVRSLSCGLYSVQHQPVSQHILLQPRACLRPGRGSGNIWLNRWGRIILAIIIERESKCCL